MLRRTRLVFLVALAVLVVPLVGGAGGWVWAESIYTESWAQWLEARRAEGYRFENATPRTSGFPSRIELRLDDFAMTAPDGWRWEPPAVQGEASLLAPFEMRLNGPGEHGVVTPDGRRLTLAAESADGRLAFDPERGLDRGNLRLGGIALAGLPAGRVSAEFLETTVGPRRQEGNGPATTVFTTEARGLTLPPDADTPFGRRIERLELRGRLEGDLPAGQDAQALQAWRAAGGGVDVDHLRVVWPPLTMSGEGRLSLDPELRPQGRLDMAVQGLEAAMDRLAEAGVLDAKTAGYVKLAVVALGRQDSEHGKTTVQVPVTLRDGRLYLGPVPLLKLSPVLADRTTRLGALQ